MQHASGDPAAAEVRETAVAGTPRVDVAAAASAAEVVQPGEPIAPAACELAGAVDAHERPASAGTAGARSDVEDAVAAPEQRISLRVAP